MRVENKTARLFGCSLLALLLLGCGHAGSQRQGLADGLKELQWLVGEWVSEGERSTTYESWRRTGEALTGTGRTTDAASGEIEVTETLRLVARGRDVLYIATVAHNPGPVAFRLAEQGPSRFVFENPTHDFPTRIIYERSGVNSMSVTVSGEDGGGFRILFQRLAGR